MIDKRHRIYVLFAIDDVNLLKEISLLFRARAAFVKMNAVPESVDSKLMFSFAIMDSYEAAG